MITRLPFVVCVFSLFCMLIHLWIHLFYCICFSFDELATFDLYHCLHSVLFTLFLFSFLPSIGAEVVEPWSPSHFFKKGFEIWGPATKRPQSRKVLFSCHWSECETFVLFIALATYLAVAPFVSGIFLPLKYFSSCKII